MEKCDMIPIKLNGNDMGWSFHLKHFVEGQGLFMYQDGTIPKATEEKPLSTWSVKITPR